MGNFLEKPITEKVNSHGEGNGIRFGVGSMQGWRTEMEDAHVSQIGLGKGYEDWSFFAVFDGHGGSSVSTFCAENLLDCIMSTPLFGVGAIKEAIVAGFLNLDASLLKKPEFSSGEDKAGSTAICAFVNPSTIYIANAGDSRGIWSQGGSLSSTVDHKPANPSERDRIINAGGSVILQRINGSLAVSRGVGDFQYKADSKRPPFKQMVSIEPDVHIIQRDDDNDEFLVLACDGIWDVMLNDDMSDYLRYLLSITPDLESVVNQIMDTCIYKNSFDNMSVLVVTFSKAPKLCPIAMKQDEELNQKLENLVRNTINTQRDVDLKHVVNILEEEDIKELPPGGGIAAKMTLVKQIYDQIYLQKAEKGASPSNNDTS